MSDRFAFESGRPDGRFVHIEGLVHKWLKEQKPALAFDPEMTPDAFAAWRERVAEKAVELLQFPQDVPEQPAPKRLWAKRRDGYELQKWEAYPEPYSVVPFLVLVPDGVNADKPGPAVMCFPGSQSSKELLAGEPEVVDHVPEPEHPNRDRMALHYVKAGLVAVAVDNPGTGERSLNLFRNRLEYSSSAICIVRWKYQR